MKIIVNGTAKEIDEGTSLGEFIGSSIGNNAGIIVELNKEIIPKERRSDYRLQEGDVIELIQFIGGG